MGCVLSQHDEFGKKEQESTHYLSKKFFEYECRYLPLKKHVVLWYGPLRGLYAILYYIVNFKDGTTKVLV